MSEEFPRKWFVVRCLRCGHEWDEENPDAEVCACFDTYGERKVEIVSAGATNV
jgi:hypothetical protein